MLTFFRRIRKGLLDGGATRKYLLYALGEIALVVIGILIALQINNWNTSKHLKIEEKSILEEIVKNVETNIDEANDDLWVINDMIESIDIILNHFNSDLPFQDSLSKHLRIIFNRRYFNGANSGFQVLVNNPEITLVEELKFDLTTYFEESIEDVERSMEGMDDFANKYKIDYLLYFKNEPSEISNRSIIIPKDYSALRKDEAFKTSLYLLRDARLLTAILINRFLDNSEDVLIKLEKYVQSEFGI